jgi:hypothetical protein
MFKWGRSPGNTHRSLIRIGCSCTCTVEPRLRTDFFLCHFCYRLYDKTALALQQSLVTFGASKIMESRPTNQEILQVDLSNNLDTLHDLDMREATERKGLGKSTSRITVILVGWSNSLALAQLSDAIPWHPALAEYGASALPLHDVHLVSVPQTNWPTSFKHWSLYSQGKFFHLVHRNGRPQLQIDPFTIEESKAELDAIRWQVQCDNVHRLNAHAGSRQIPMIAYNIGQTQFDVSRMECLADHIAKQFKNYTRREKNCHLFVISLATRVLMTKGMGTIFVGTKAQLAHWDLMAASGEESSPYSQGDGFLLRAPNKGKFSSHKHRQTVQILMHISISRALKPFKPSLSQFSCSVGRHTACIQC